MDKDLASKLANVPMAQPGFDALNLSAPVIMQLNKKGTWEKSKPGNLDEEKLKAVVQHLVNSKTLSAAQNYCTCCASENKNISGPDGKSKYVPVILMPIHNSEQCPFDMEGEVDKLKDETKKSTAKKTKNTEKVKDEKKDKIKKPKKRGFVLQRFNDFDLLSQW